MESFNGCHSCKREFNGAEVRLRRIVTNDLGKYERYCTECVQGTVTIKDAFYPYGSGTHTEENICDPETGKPIPFSSKNGKWEAMQKARVCEVGDRVHGARTTFTK